MNWDVLIVALLAGGANWMFRVLPTRARTDRMKPGGLVERFLAATGPAAIGTLFVASLLPLVSESTAQLVPVATGTSAVVVTFLATRSVVGSTLAGSVVYGLVVWLLV